MNVNELREWAKTVRLFTEDGDFNCAIPQTKQGIFNAVLGELIAWHDCEWGPLSQEGVNTYLQVRKWFVEAVE